MAGWLLLAFIAAAVGAVAATDAPTFYAELVRPAWAPPASIFGPVWSVLYAFMAVSAWLVWRARDLAPARAALVLFIVQLAANALWSWLFFAWRFGALAFAEVLLLWGLIVATSSDRPARTATRRCHRIRPRRASARTSARSALRASTTCSATCARIAAAASRRRPIRPKRNWKGDNFLGKDPASTKVRHRPVDTNAHEQFAATIRRIAPKNR